VFLCLHHHRHTFPSTLPLPVLSPGPLPSRGSHPAPASSDPLCDSYHPHGDDVQCCAWGLGDSDQVMQGPRLPWEGPAVKASDGAACFLSRLVRPLVRPPPCFDSYHSAARAPQRPCPSL